MYDYVIIGSGFGGSVSALRLSEKGYKVLVIEKGKWLGANDFPKSNWHLKKWLWMPRLGMQGLFKITYFRHVAVLSGVGVGGGSLVYANTLPIPKKEFYATGSWAKLDNWQSSLEQYYTLAKKMLGAEKHPYIRRQDEVMRTLAERIGKPNNFETTTVSVYFGEEGVTVPDPYFEGKGPDRTGCNQCGGCMLGCRYNAKNTLDKNYLHLAQQLGTEILAEKIVYDVKPLSNDGSEGYEVHFKDALKNILPKKGTIKTKGVIFAGGVLGTVALLLKLKKSSLPNISDKVGADIRTNSESLVGVTTFDKDKIFSEGIAIGSIVNIDEHTHIEPVKYTEGNGFWRLLMAPMVQGSTIISRFFRMMKDIIIHPIQNLRVAFVDDWSKRTQILLYMESIDSTLQFKRNIFGGLSSSIEQGKAPTAFNPQAQVMANHVADIIHGKPMVMVSETLLGIPTTAHILGGAVMGKDSSEGVIDKDNHVFGYKNMMVCDGSMISANPGVNPSLSITAIAEYAMSKVPNKN